MNALAEPDTLLIYDELHKAWATLKSISIHCAEKAVAEYATERAAEIKRFIDTLPREIHIANINRKLGVSK